MGNFIIFILGILTGVSLTMVTIEIKLKKKKLIFTEWPPCRELKIGDEIMIDGTKCIISSATKKPKIRDVSGEVRNG